MRSHLSCWSSIWKQTTYIFSYRCWCKVTHGAIPQALHFWFQWREIKSRTILFPWCVCEGKAEGWGQCVCVWEGDVGKRMKEELFTVVLGKYSIYTCTLRKITSCISPPQSDNFFPSLFYIQYITHSDSAYYTWVFIREGVWFKRNPLHQSVHILVSR